MVGQDDDATSLPRAQPRVRVHVRWAGRVAMFHVGPDVTVMQLVRRMVPPLPPLDAIFFCRNATRIELDASVGPGDPGVSANTGATASARLRPARYGELNEAS